MRLEGGQDTRRCGPSGGRATRGFTIVELAIVITVIMIIAAIIVPGMRAVVVKANEETLKTDLVTMRKMIDQYTKDKQKAPQSLDDLVDERYIPEIPVDPMTDEAEWDVILEEGDPISLKGDRGVVDVKSRSNAYSSKGDRYSDW